MENKIFKLLVEDENDIVGALAYALYKQEKIEFCESHKADNGGQVPDPTSIDAFLRHAQTETCVKGYKDRAITIFNDLINEVIEEPIKEANEEYKNTLLPTLIKEIKCSLDSKKGWVGWIASITENLMVNIATILIVAALAFGLNKMDDIQNGIKTIFTSSGMNK